MHSEIIDKKKFRNEIISSSQEIRNILEDDSKFLLNSNTILEDRIQKYISSISDSRINNSIIKPMILDAVFRSEITSGGSGIICLEIISSLTGEYLKKNNLGVSVKDIEIELDDNMLLLSKCLSQNSRKLKRSDLDNLIDKQFDLDIHKKIIRKFISIAGVFSPVSLERSSRNETVIFFSKGFKFKIHTSRATLSGKTSWERSSVKCLVIDGFIESIGEIHHLLEKVTSERSPHIIFARHISDEVMATILLNLRRGTLDLMPIEVGFDENTLNILNDISICCNTDLISSLKGDTISAACRKDLVTIDKIVVTESEIKITNKPDVDLLESHVRFLTDKMSELREPEISGLINERIKSLSAEESRISLGHDLISNDRQSIEKFDKFFREIRGLIDYGVVYPNDLNINVPGMSLDSTYPYATSSVYMATKNAFSTIKSIISIEKAILMK